MDIKPEELSEKDFIQNEKNLNPWPMWLWIVIVAAIAALLWGIGSWYIKVKEQLYHEYPFFQVTNRQFSLFLWQNPEYMRINVSNKTAYLPGFQYLEKVNIEPGQAEGYVEAPPSVIFAYHVWDRLLSHEIPLRSISKDEFIEFLKYSDEWNPKNWPNAPKEYGEFIKKLSSSSVSNLATLPMTTLPLEVRQAFEGWRNYFKEGNQINSVKPTYALMKDFLDVFPDYARHYWRNIYLENKPNYLKKLTDGNYQAQEIIPDDELSGLLKVNFYNFLKSKNSSS